jgi:thiosulfate/3-mercaptopyruvate sulfurtransferase
MDKPKRLIDRREFVRDAALVAAVSSLTGSLLKGRDGDFPAIVTPEWLAGNLAKAKIAVIDIRSADQYRKGHIPGSISVPLNSWAVNKNGLSLELPQEDALRGLIGKAGLDADSFPVIVNRLDTDFSRADPTRVAWTCAVAGLSNVSVLDGGYNRWLRDIKSTSTEEAVPKPVVFTGKMNMALLASKEYVWKKIGKSTLVDARMPEDYFGITEKAGHIKSAVNLPTPWVFASDGIFRKPNDLRAMAEGVLGTNKTKEIIVYCGVGGYATTWWFLLTRVLDYLNVKVYDGSIEEWLKDAAAPVSAYTWH